MKTAFSRATLGLTLFCALPSLAATETVSPLTLQKALELARQNSPTLAGAAARVAGAAAHLNGAGKQPSPTLSLAQPYALKGQTGGFDEGILAAQTFELGGKRGARTAIARGELAAARFDQTGALATLDFAIRQAYFEALRADAERDLAADALKVAQQFLEAGKTQFEAGDVARRDVVRANIEVARAQNELDKAQTESDNRYAALRSLLGLPETASLQLADALDFQPDNLDLSALQTLAAQKRADAQSAAALTLAREAAVREARTVNKPDAFIEGRKGKIYPSSNGLSVRVGIVVPFYDWGRTRSGVREAQAALAGQNATVQETRRTILLDVTTAFNTLQSARRTVESFRKGRLDQDKELLDMAQTGYQRGASSYLEVLDAQQLLRAEQTEYARALAAWNVARADLQRAVGGTLP